MAKGQVRGNRETRKPKKEKAAPKVELSVGTQVKRAGAPTQPLPRKGGKA